MAHLHTEPGQHDVTASAYIVRTDMPEPTVLMHMHKILHKWLQFGGHVELHENLWQAVIHEVREESGYELSQLKLLQPDIKRAVFSDAASHPWPANIMTVRFPGLDHYHTDIAYAFTTGEDPAGNVDDKESTEFRAFTHAELAKLTDEEIPANVRETGLIILGDYLKTWKQIAVD